MKVHLSGFERHADTLGVQTLERFRWQDVSGVLAIPGVSYYIVETGYLGVRYGKLADERDVTAQTIRVLADAQGIAPEELVVIVDDTFLGDIKALEIADDVWQRACVAATPPSVPLQQIEPRGTGPAYWLRS